MWFVIALLNCQPQAHASEPGVIEIGDLRHQLLRAPASFLVTEDRVPLERALEHAFRPLVPDHVNQGISSHSYWIHARLMNSGPRPVRWVMHHETAYLDNMAVYLADASGSTKASLLSDRLPFTSRPLAYRKLAFVHTTGPGDWTDVYLRLDYDKADSMSLNVHLWEQAAFTRHMQQEYLLYGGYYGILLALVFVALLFAVVMREATYLYYALFLVVSGLMWSLLNGLAFQYLFPGSVFWQNEGYHIGYLLFGLTAFQFSRAFLHTARYFPWTDRAMRVLQLIMLLAIGLRLLGNYEIVLNLAFASLALPLLILPALGWRAYRRGMTYARWFAVSWLIYSLGLVISLASAYTRFFSWGMESLLYTQICTLIESLFLLVALAERLLAREADRREALQLANHDPLTQLGNRRLLEQHYTALARQVSSTGHSIYLLMLDLDHFKAINDTYGHLAGDAILQRLAGLLRQHAGQDDVCIRLGGEEFAMLLKAHDLEEARHVAERIRREFAATPTLFREQRITHTLSVGLAAALTPWQCLPLSEAMIRADEALYRAKATSRNCTAFFIDAPASPE
ncbi:MAG: diguanylate cyclase [Halomonas sp.]|nr:diguanylate cyclase [Halomonas sp.]